MAYLTRSLLRKATWLLAVVVLPGMALGPAQLPATPGSVPGPSDVAPACEATLDPDEVSPGEDPIIVGASFTQSVGPLYEVVIEEGSRVEILDVLMVSQTEFELTLATADAQEGDWTITLTGEAGTCVGELSVARDDPDPLR